MECPPARLPVGPTTSDSEKSVVRTINRTATLVTTVLMGTAKMATIMLAVATQSRFSKRDLKWLHAIYWIGRAQD